MTKECSSKLPFPETQNFVREAYEAALRGETQTVLRPGEIISLPILMPINQRPERETDPFQRRANAALLYLFADAKSLKEKYQTQKDIAALYGVSSTQIGLDIGQYLQDLHAASPTNIREKYPFSSLKTQAPETLATKIRRAEKNGGREIDIVEDLQKGMSIKDLVEKYGSKTVTAARCRLTRWGLPAPERQTRDFRPIITKIKDPNTTIEEQRTLILEFNDHQVIKTYSRGNNAVIAFVSEWQKDAWGNTNKRNTAAAYDLLKKAGIPVNTVPLTVTYKNEKIVVYYRFGFKRNTQDALNVLKNADPSLRNNNQVRQIAGPEFATLPNTNDLKKGKLVSLFRSLREHGLGIGHHSKLRSIAESNFRDSPVGIVLYPTKPSGEGKRYYIYPKDAEIFASYLRQKLGLA